MAWGREKGTDVKISALPVSMRFFDFVPCSLPLKTLILLTFLCFLIRRRGRAVLFCVHHFRGRVTVTVVPSPSRLVRDTVPWW